MVPVLAEACAEDCGWWRSAVHRVLAPLMLIGVVLDTGLINYRLD